MPDVEEVENRKPFFENLLFALLGGMTALIVSLGTLENEMGDSPSGQLWRTPSSMTVALPEDAVREKLEQRIELPILE